MGLRNLFGLLGRPASAPRNAVQSGDGGVIITTPDQLDDFLRRGGRASPAGVFVTHDTAMRVAAVFRCVAIISGAVANMPLDLRRRVDARTREDASDHPLWRVLRRRPNPWMTPSGFRRMLTMHVLLRGNAYALVVRSRGRITELLPLHPDQVKVEQRDDLSLRYTWTRRTGEPVALAQAEVFHLVGLTFDGVHGMSVLEYARNTIGSSIAMETHGAKLFANGATLGAVVKHPGKLSDPATESLQRRMEEFRGSENAHKTMVLEEGMDWQSLGMTSEDSQWIESRTFNRRDIAMFFGVPPHMIGDTEASTSWGTGIEQTTLGFIAYTLQDWLTTWQETIERDLIAENEPNLFVRFNLAGLVRGDIKTRTDAYSRGRQWGWWSPNDIREMEDQNPIEGGDVYHEPVNMRPLGDDQGETETGEPSR